MIASLIKFFFSENLAMVDASYLKNGETQLHFIARHAKSLTEIKNYLAQLKDQASDMARTLDDDGYLPIELFFKNRYISDREKNSGIDLLREITISKSVKPLNEMLNLQDVLACYENISDKIRYNLTMACDIANIIRSHPWQSGTHPQTNQMPWDEQVTLENKIVSARKLRLKNFREKGSYLPEMRYAFYRSRQASFRKVLTMEVKLSHQSKEALIESMANQYQENYLGNCGEMSFAALHAFFKKYSEKKVNAKIISVKSKNNSHSDHAFIVISSAFKKRINCLSDFAELSEDAVICDPWLGKVYQAKDIAAELVLFDNLVSKTEQGNILFNILVKYHPGIHYFQEVAPSNDIIKIDDVTSFFATCKHLADDEMKMNHIRTEIKQRFSKKCVV